MGHKRNGKAAKARRRETASDRKKALDQHYDYVNSLTPEERLIHAIFGAWETCMECGNEKLVRSDCNTPHCKAIRDEASVFYKKVTEDYVEMHGGSFMRAGIDY